MFLAHAIAPRGRLFTRFVTTVPFLILMKKNEAHVSSMSSSCVYNLFLFLSLEKKFRMWVNLDKRAKNSNYEFNVITVVLLVFRKSNITTMQTQISLGYEF